MSSLVLGGQPSTLLLLFNGGSKQAIAIAKSAVVAGSLVLTSGQNELQGLVGAEGNVEPIVQAYGSFGASDIVWTVGSAEEVQCVGVDNQPVTLTPVLGSALVP